jgi:Chaperone of endosialidase
MNQLIQFPNHDHASIKSISRARVWRGFVLSALASVCFAVAPPVRASDVGGVIANGSTADGSGVLPSQTTGAWNSGFGLETLNHDTTGGTNTALGVRALFSNTSGKSNTATGVYSLYTNSTGSYNTAIGHGALQFNTKDWNTAVGFQALHNNTTGTTNTASGYQALFNNTSGYDNTAYGIQALVANTTGVGNTAIGELALNNNNTGMVNIAIGSGAGSSVTTADNVIAIGTEGENVSNSCYIGNIFGVTSSGSTAVFVNSFGKLGTVTSSRRFKDEIKPMDQASEAILALKPVTFRYKKEIDAQQNPQFGLVAEDVEKVNPDLVVRDAEGRVNTVRYEAVNAMLLNEFLKEHAKVQQLEATVSEQRKGMKALAAQIKEQNAKIEKVSAQLERRRPAPQLVMNSP